MTSNALDSLVEALGALADAVDIVSSEEKSFQALYGWPAPALDRRDLVKMVRGLENTARELRDSELPAKDVEYLNVLVDQIDSLRTNTVPHLYNGNWNQSVACYINTISGLREILSSFLAPSWVKLEDPSLMPKSLARRVRGISALLNQIDPDVQQLDATIREIREAHDAANDLPADLELLQATRNKLESLQSQSSEYAVKISGVFEQVIVNRDVSKQHLQEAELLIKQIRDLHRVGTSTTLAGAFQARADALSTTVWGWLGILVVALIAGVYIGEARVSEISEAMKFPDVNWQGVWVNVVLTILGVSAPVWLGWISTKQIIQRFRLAEDYAYKASISNAYEGYRREAVNLDSDFQARLFGSALTRLDEVPGRLVDSSTHGSPFHEFASSELARQAISIFPGFVDKVTDLAKEIVHKSPATKITEEVKYQKSTLDREVDD